MSNVCMPVERFDVVNTDDRGRICVAKASLSKGQIITSNKPFCWLVRNEYVDSRCSHCFQREANLMSCSSCKRMRYCSKECQKMNWKQHKIECKHIKDISQIVSSSAIDDIITLLRLISKPDKSYVSCNVENNVVTCCNDHVVNMCCTPTGFTDETLLTISTVCKLSKHSMQTVSRMLFQCRSNNFGVTDDLLACVGVGVYPHAALLNHSCTPNCVLRYSLLPSGPLLEIVALRDIGAGEELCHSYCDCTFPRALRQHNLRSTFGFDCHCELCSTSSSPHEHVLSGLRNAHDLSSRSPSPVAIRDFFRSLGHARPLLNTDVWLLESACEQNEYSDALQQAGALCREAQMIDLSSEDHISGEKEKEEKEKEEKKATRLLESAVTLMQRVCGPFHMELYQMRGMLMTSYLTAGNINDALIQCKYIVSFLCVALNHLPHHPLLGLQLFTLGDLATHCEDTQLASDAYLWASEILTVSHGPESEMFRRLVQSIRDTDKE